MNLNWFTVFVFSVVLYQFGFVTPVPSVIVYGVFPVFTLNTYSIPGFTVPADTVKSLDGVMLFDMSSIAIAFHVRVCHWKSAYFISPTHVHVSCHLKLLLSSYHKFCPTCGEFDDLTLCGFNLVTISIYLLDINYSFDTTQIIADSVAHRLVKVISPFTHV